jgi:hypothetical protein
MVEVVVGETRSKTETQTTVARGGSLPKLLYNMSRYQLVRIIFRSSTERKTEKKNQALL